MLKKVSIVLLVILALVLLVGCMKSTLEVPQVTDTPQDAPTVTPESVDYDAEVLMMFVDSELFECVGVGPMQCMRVKDTPEGEWKFFYDQIEGFDFESGFTYELRVAVYEVENPPADASSLRYELVEIVNSESVDEPSGEVKTLYVDSELFECVGVGPMQCMRVKDTAEGEWKFFYDHIEGFDFESGFTYELRVSVYEVENPPADASSLRYELVEIISKEHVSE